MGRFPPQFVDDLKAQADIVQVVQDVVPLRKAGNSFKGLCPFHNEKTPSFHVNQEKGFFKCFGCGVGGDVVKFVELHEKLPFPDAVRMLAQRFGLPVPESGDPERDAAADARREAMLKVHGLAAAFFQQHLAGAGGSAARQHLEARGILPETAQQLGLGLAPPQRDALLRHLLDAGQSRELLIESGLAVQRDGGRVVDRFRNRLMIPICRHSGSRDSESVVAFGGRALEERQQPKYINSPESPLYVKSQTLYGLHLTKAAIRSKGYAVMVEGYFDFAQLLQAGVQPVVATCGTAVTAQQARLLQRFTSNVYISFDSDTAGRNAAVRTGELLVGEGLQAKIATLPDGIDPDTCVRREGRKRYLETLRTSQHYLDYVLEAAAAERDLSSAAQRQAFLKEMLAVAARVPDAPARDQFGDRIAHRAGVMEDVVRSEIRRAAVGRRTTMGEAVSGAVGQRVTPAEQGLIWSMLNDTPSALAALADLEPPDFEGLATEPILLVARTLVDWPADAAPSALLERVGGDGATLAQQLARPARAAAGARDCANELLRRRLLREQSALQAEIARLQDVGTAEAQGAIDGLWQRKMALVQRIEQLRED